MAKKKNQKPKESQIKVIHLDDYRKEVAALKEEGRHNYRPKIGRRLAKLEKKIKKIA